MRYRDEVRIWVMMDALLLRESTNSELDGGGYSYN